MSKRASYLGAMVALVCSTINTLSFSGKMTVGRYEDYLSDNTEDLPMTQRNHNEQQKQQVPNSLCPAVIQQKVGLFNPETSNSKVKDLFPDTVLLVTANYAYYNILQNWEWLANELGLQWAVLALDERIYQELGPDRAVPSDESFAVSGEQTFRRGQFNALVCNKMNMALEISKNCGFNVVFTDADNIFLKNPFEHDLGKMIRSNIYDYIYQPNQLGHKERDHNCIRGEPDEENNTGFYYIRYGNEIYKRVVQDTMAKCHHPENKLDDQSLFWQSLSELKKEIGDGAFHHCGSYSNEWHHAFHDASLETQQEQLDTNPTFQYCCMDPYYYQIGKGKRKGKGRRKGRRKGRDKQWIPINRDPVTFHANYVSGYYRKIQKLKGIREDGYGWNTTRFIDGKGDILKE